MYMLLYYTNFVWEPVFSNHFVLLSAYSHK